jgi:hypothetical protein
MLAQQVDSCIKGTNQMSFFIFHRLKNLQNFSDNLKKFLMVISQTIALWTNEKTLEREMNHFTDGIWNVYYRNHYVTDKNIDDDSIKHIFHHHEVSFFHISVLLTIKIRKINPTKLFVVSTSYQARFHARVSRKIRFCFSLFTA